MSVAVICCHFNPAGFVHRSAHLQVFIDELKRLRVPVFAAELAYDKDPYCLPDEKNFYRFRCSREHIFWHKENLLNLAAKRVPAEYDKIAWVDSDIRFDNLEWIAHADRALNEKAVVQLFAEAHWTDRHGGIFRKMSGAAAH